MNSAITNIIRNLTHEKFICILAGVFLQLIAFENPDVFGKTDIEATNAFHAADVGGEIPDVLVSLMASDELLRTGIFLYE